MGNGPFAAYVQQGVWHIWSGTDHILFLMALLLPAVLVRVDGRWLPVTTFRAALIAVVKTVTAFTVAHSITLTLAALGYIHAPSRLVESAIAASVLIAALNNVVPLFKSHSVLDRAWLMAFVFGLVHGLGFANVLFELGLPRQTLLLALVGFNVGVELGQLAIVAVFLPTAFALRGTTLYARAVMQAGSAVVMLLAAVWFVERAFAVELI